MRRHTLILGRMLLALPLGIFWFAFRPYDERTQLVLSDYYGTVTSGTKLGVTVGSPWTDADAAIRGQFTPDYVMWRGGVCKGDDLRDGVYSTAPVLVGRAMVSYRDRSWRNGSITLCMQDGVVTALSWHYPGPFYFDF